MPNNPFGFHLRTQRWVLAWPPQILFKDINFPLNTQKIGSFECNPKTLLSSPTTILFFLSKPKSLSLSLSSIAWSTPLHKPTHCTNQLSQNPSTTRCSKIEATWSTDRPGWLYDFELPTYRRAYIIFTCGGQLVSAEQGRKKTEKVIEK